MKTILTIALTLLALNSPVFAGEGHDHGPGQVQPTRGGILMKGHDFFLEAVGTKSEIKFYPLKKENSKSNALKPIPLKDVKITANYSLPRGKANQPILLSQNSDYFSGKVEAGSTHRYQVDVSVEVSNEKEKFTYQIELQE
ncbi:MAG: hypothetical protein JNM93_10860 [Bacteriovoracaceae bacterium]|nr:hypothetical protein [Bacteriovoracaceae bacterium]